MTGSSHITRAFCLVLCMGGALTAPIVLAQSQDKTPARDPAREVVDIDAEIDAMRRARASLSREIKEFEALLDNPLRRPQPGSTPARAPAPEPDQGQPVRDVVDVEAELAKARELRGRLSRELKELLQGLQGAGARLQRVEDAQPELAALRARVEALSEQLEQTRTSQRATEAARERLVTQLAKLNGERKQQQATLESVNQRMQALTKQAASAATATATALTALEQSYGGRLQAMQQQLEQARASQAALRQRVGEAESLRDDLKTRLAVAPVLASQRAGDARSAEMVAQIKALSDELASIRRGSADARNKLEQAHMQQVQALEQQLARLGSQESTARSRLQGAEAKGDALRKSMLEQIDTLQAERDALARELAGERKALAVSRARVETLQADRGKPAAGVEELRNALSALRQEASESRKTQTERIAKLESERAALHSTQQQLRAELARGKSVLQARNERVSALIQALTAARAELTTLQAKRESLQGEALTLREQLAGKGARSQTLDEQLAAVGSELADARTSLGTLRTERSTLSDELTALQAERESLQGEALTLREQLAGASARNQTLDEQLTAVGSELADARTSLGTLRTALSDELTGDDIL